MLFNRKKDPEPAPVEIKEPVKEPEAPQPKGPDYSPMHKTVIGSGITFYGDFETADPIELNGTIKGDINSKASITISKDAEYFGNANMDSLNLSGTIEGDIDCKETSTFSSTAHMKGNLRTAYLVTDKGSNFKGNLTLAKEDDAVEAAPTEEPKAPDAPEKAAPAETVPAKEMSSSVDDLPESYWEDSKKSEADAKDGDENWNIDDYFKGPANAEKLEKTDEMNFEDRFAAIEKDAEALMNEEGLDMEEDLFDKKD